MNVENFINGFDYVDIKENDTCDMLIGYIFAVNKGAKR